MTRYVSDAEIAARLNELAYTRRNVVISRRHGCGALHNPGAAPDLFPGQVLVGARRDDRRRWTADLVSAELASVTA